MIFKKYVALLVCLSLFISACSPDKSNKASSKAGELARNKVELAYELCSNKDKVIVEAEMPIKSIDEMECITAENGNATCTKEDNTKCELKKVELCNELGEDCKDFEFGKTKVLCNEPSDKSKGACLPMKLRGEKEDMRLLIYRLVHCTVPWSCQIQNLYNLHLVRCTAQLFS
ncbi:MAG: hypothetical protein LE180_06560, partial [Endomicrobium sp.]|uniref:hypothetical protein n=1 Tax=Candidatus Endomicrobiellum pyrsonymphae TaxID=1408203 RepID=UPI003572B4E6|nr:hypothetical protein [Endomicrobium sp.]